MYASTLQRGENVKFNLKIEIIGPKSENKVIRNKVLVCL